MGGKTGKCGERGLSFEGQSFISEPSAGAYITQGAFKVGPGLVSI